MPKDFRITTNPATAQRYTRVTRADILREIDDALRDLRVGMHGLNPESETGLLVGRSIKRLAKIHHLATLGSQ